MSLPRLRHISECFIRPKFEGPNSNHREQIFLTPWDLMMISLNYMQKGFLFANPPPKDEEDRVKKEYPLERLKSSLSHVLVHFYPLAGQLVTEVHEDQHTSCIFVDCNKGPGAKFSHAALDVTVNDVLSTSNDLPEFVNSLFDKDAVINHDGHFHPLLSIQVTYLIDGIFIGCSMNHSVADGISFWHFANMWSEIYNKLSDENINLVPISRPPIHKLWFPDGHEHIVRLPYTHPDQFIARFQSPPLREKIFHFSSESLARLKAKANAECNTNTISTFLAISALVWRSITRARSFTHDQQTICRLLADNRQRLNPPLSPENFGNCIFGLLADTEAGVLLSNSIGSAALLLKKAIADYTDRAIRDWIGAYIKSPFVIQINPSNVACAVTITSSPKFNMYANEFGLGKPLCIRSGRAGKSDGIVICYPGRKGGGSVDLEICLAPKSMTALESDEEFMDVVSC